MTIFTDACISKINKYAQYGMYSVAIFEYKWYSLHRARLLSSAQQITDSEAPEDVEKDWSHQHGAGE